MLGSANADTISGNAGNDTISAGAGANSVAGGEGNNILTTDLGNDTITAGAGNDTITAGAGNDSITAGSGNNSVDAGADNDTITTTGSGNNTILGGAGNDTITCGTGADDITGGGGLDTITLGGGANILRYTAVADSTGVNLDTVNGFVSGTDSVFVTLAWGTSATMDVSGFASVASFSNGLVSLAGTTGTPVVGDSFYSTVEGQLYVDVNGDGQINQGTDYTIALGTVAAGDLGFVIPANNGVNTTITGGAGADNISGGTGTDAINGGAGNDTIVGGAGNDTITGGTGADDLTGGGSDTFNYASGDASVIGYTKVSVAGTVTAPNATDTFTGAEVIRGLVTGASVSLGNASLVVDAGVANTLEANEFVIVQGTYAGGVFTVGATLNTGVDSLIIYDADATAGVLQAAIVLVGVTSVEEGFIVNTAGVLTVFGA